MAEYIDRKALGIGKCNPDVFENKGYAEGWNSAIEIIESAPAADVVDVVRCKDCKHCVVREYDIIDELECEFFDVFTDPLDYCSRGERKVENG